MSPMAILGHHCDNKGWSSGTTFFLSLRNLNSTVKNETAEKGSANIWWGGSNLVGS